VCDEIGARHRALMHDRDGRLLAASDARCGHHVDFCAQQRRQAREQIACASHLATQTVADANGERRGLFAVVQHFEVVIEGRDLIHLGHRHVGFLRQRDEVPLVQAEVPIVQQVQMLDEQIAPPARLRLLAEEGPHFSECRVFGLTTFHAALALDALSHLVGAHGSDDWHCDAHGCIAPIAIR
jgi:hypothetical protein